MWGVAGAFDTQTPTAKYENLWPYVRATVLNGFLAHGPPRSHCPQLTNHIDGWSVYSAFDSLCGPPTVIYRPRRFIILMISLITFQPMFRPSLSYISVKYWLLILRAGLKISQTISSLLHISRTPLSSVFHFVLNNFIIAY